MKKFVLIFLILAFSCKNSTELITTDSWYLSNKFIITEKDGKTYNELIYYKKTDKVLGFHFNSDGSVLVKELNGEKHSKVNWNWKTESQDYITISNGIYKGDFKVSDLDLKKLTLTKTSFVGEYSTQVMYFKHLDDEEWPSDESVDALNNTVPDN